MGRDSLSLRRDSRRDTFWTPKPSPKDLRRYFQQF
jgi:hypothetical protein